MGGIAGIMSFSRARADSRRVDRMLELLDHRGPDDRGARRSANGRLMLGGCRSLLQESETTLPLPMLSEHEDVWAVLDGEIDNHRALRHSLRLDGHTFRSEVMGEVVVHAYEQYGLTFLDHLHGRFALALWDESRHRLVLARDRLGERPLYWARAEGMFGFASEATALLDGLPIPRRLDLDSLPEYLAQGFVLAPNTMIEGIRKLGPGEALIIERGNRVQPLSWWSPCRDERRAAAVRGLSSEHHENNLRVLLDSAIADRLTANLPVAAMLDGEPESLAMAASMGRLLGRTVETMVLGQRQAELLRGPAAGLGLKLTPVLPGEAQVLAYLPDYLRAMDEPLTDPSAIGAWWLARAMSNSGLMVGLASAGAAAVLLGPELLARHRHVPAAWRVLRALPPAARRCALRLWPPMLRLWWSPGNIDALRNAVDGEPSLPASQGVFAEAAMVLAHDFKTLAKIRPPGEALGRARRSIPSWISADELGALAFIETRTTMADSHLMALDRMAMAHSVQLRMPFMDDALVDYSLAIPSHERASGGHPKDLLMRALRGLLPPKPAPGEGLGQPVEAPIARWFRGELAGIFEDLLQRSRLFQSGVLDRQACLGLLRDHQVGRQSHHRQLWSLLVLAQWADLRDLEIAGRGLEEPVSRAAVG